MKYLVIVLAAICLCFAFGFGASSGPATRGQNLQKWEYATLERVNSFSWSWSSQDEANSDTALDLTSNGNANETIVLIVSLRGADGGQSLDKELISQTAIEEGEENALAKIIGDDAAARDVVKQLNDYSAKTDFSPSELQAAYTVLIGSGMAASNGVNVVEILGNAVDATGGDADTLQQAVSILRTMAATHAVQVQSLVEMFPGLGDTIIRFTGEASVSDAIRTMESGNVSVNSAINLVLDGLDKKYPANTAAKPHAPLSAQTILDLAGQQGWELVSASGDIFILKRPISQ
jgi:hypothetical protein